jgi:hypothetical protein
MKATIEFKQTVTYTAEIDIDEDSLYNLEDWEGETVSETSDIEVFGLLSQMANMENISKAEQRFEFMNVIFDKEEPS